MRKMGPVKRLQTLIDHLDTEEYRTCPHGVGLKTAIQARELGLVEFKEERGRWTYRLTERGENYRTALDRAVSDISFHSQHPFRHAP